MRYAILGTLIALGTLLAVFKVARYRRVREYAPPRREYEAAVVAANAAAVAFLSGRLLQFELLWPVTIAVLGLGYGLARLLFTPRSEKVVVNS